MTAHPKPPFPKQKQSMPGETNVMEPVPDHGEQSYRGCGRLADKKAVITGADSGIGRAVAIAFAREGADVLIAYLSEHDDAKEIREAREGRRQEGGARPWRRAECRSLPQHRQEGRIRTRRDRHPVNNAAHQATFKSIEDISDEEWELTFKVNIHAMF